jgi:glycosyltransferase involved in cell wall biosynthesis
VGFDTLSIVECLAAAGWEAAVHSGGSDAEVSRHATPDVAPWLDDPSATLVWVNASFWPPIEPIISRFPGRRVMRFHAGPPPGLFQDSDRGFQADVVRYWALTHRITPFFDRFLCVSENAAQRLVAAGADARRIQVTGVFHNLDGLHRAPRDPDTARLLEADARKLVLTVSRIAAQKRQEDVVHVARAYLAAHPGDARFLLVGGRQPDGAAERVSRLVRELGLEEDVVLLGRLGPGGLRACYERADVLLSMSRSESFCVPIIEAQSFRVPVIARASMAVPDTMGAGGILIEDVDFDSIARTLHSVLHDDRVRTRLVEAGSANVGRFEPRRVARAVIDGLDRN